MLSALLILQAAIKRLLGVLSRYANPKIERVFLVPVMLLGFASVVYWHYFDDLRFYYWIQLIPLLAIPVVLIVFKEKCQFPDFKFPTR